MTLRQDLADKNFIVTAELNPPKGTDLTKLLANASKIKDKVSAINITCNSGASMKMCPLAISHLVQSQAAVEAIWQMTCRDRNRLALQSDLLGGVALGLKNILPLGGDPADKGDAPETKACFDLKTEELITAVQKLKNGKDFDDNEVDAADFDYCVGSAAHPGVPDLAGQKETMLRRGALGVEFYQTQICFEKEQISRFAESIGEELCAKTLIGVTPLKTFGQAEFIHKNIWGVDVPESSMQAMQKALGDRDRKDAAAKIDQQKQGLELAKDLVEHIKSLNFKGIHLMAIGQESVLDEIIDAIL